MHLISTPRPNYTNTGPLVVYLFFFTPPSLPFSLLFPNWCGNHGWSATVISIHFFPTFAWLPFPGTTALARVRRLECGTVAHTRPAETIDANFANDISAEVIKASAERGRKHPLLGWWEGGGGVVELNSRDLSQRKLSEAPSPQ